MFWTSRRARLSRAGRLGLTHATWALRDEQPLIDEREAKRYEASKEARLAQRSSAGRVAERAQRGHRRGRNEEADGVTLANEQARGAEAWLRSGAAAVRDPARVEAHAPSRRLARRSAGSGGCVCRR